MPSRRYADDKVFDLDRQYEDAPIGADGSAKTDAGKRAYTLLSGVASPTAANAPGVTNIRGGDYIWRAEATSWTGVTATLQFLGLDGATWINARNAANTADVTLTANGQVSIGIGQDSTVRVALTGANAGAAVRSNLAGL